MHNYHEILAEGARVECRLETGERGIGTYQCTRKDGALHGVTDITLDDGTQVDFKWCTWVEKVELEADKTQ